MDERVLLVEDDASLRESTTLILEREGMRVCSEADGLAALKRFESDDFDLLILDLMLPSLDGLEVCRRVRTQSALPIVMLTARSDTSDLVMGLELGADDYITKPFDPPALIARTRAVMRRGVREPVAADLIAGSIKVDPKAFEVTKDGQPLGLSSTETKLLIELMRNANEVISRTELLKRVWGYDYMGDSRMVDMAIKRLRSKVEHDATNPLLIVSVRGLGYRFDARQ